MSESIVTHELGKRYGRTWAVKGCTLEIPANSVTALIGPNGAGKSTLLKMVVGLAFPTEGTVRVFGHDPVREAAAVLPRFGYVGQNRSLYNHLTVEEMCRAAKVLNHQWDTDYARRKLADLAIDLNKPTGKLSGGQQAQLALTLALAKRPELIVLDEPTANLDPVARREFLQLLMDATVDHGATVVLSSHSIPDMERICDRLVIMENGAVRHTESLDSFLRSHRLIVLPGGVQDVPSQAGSVVFLKRYDRQTVALVREAELSEVGPWEVQEVGFEEIVLGYLTRRTGCAADGEDRIAS